MTFLSQMHFKFHFKTPRRILNVTPFNLQICRCKHGCDRGGAQSLCFPCFMFASLAKLFGTNILKIRLQITS